MRSTFAATLLSIAMPLSAATFTVTSGADSGPGTLRWAIEQANAAAGSDEIVWNAAMTVVLQSPLPPITDAVTIGKNPLPYWPSNIPQPAVLTIDGSGVAGDGLRISADGVVVSSIAVAHFRSGDGIVVDGNDAILTWIEESDAVNGLRVHGLRAGVYGTQFRNNQDAGLWIDPSSRDNKIGRTRNGCPPPFDACDVSPAGNDFDANGIGMRVEGEHNSFVFTTVAGNRFDGAVIEGADNPLDSVMAIQNGRNGVTILGPATPPFVVSCNGAMPFDVGGDGPTPDEDRTKSRLAAPRITAGTRYLPLMTVSGNAHAAPNRQLLVAIYVAANSNVDCERYLGQVGGLSPVTTDAAGDAHFDLNLPGARGEALYAAVTELDAARNVTATSELSAPFSPLTNVEPFADLSIEMTAPPSVVFGQVMTIEIRVTNHGPGASVPYTVSSPLSGGVEYVDNSCEVCQEPPLAPGQTAVIEQRLRVTSRRTLLPYMIQIGGLPLNDPDLSNNKANVVVAITPPPRRRSVSH